MSSRQFGRKPAAVFRFGYLVSTLALLRLRLPTNGVVHGQKGTLILWCAILAAQWNWTGRRRLAGYRWKQVMLSERATKQIKISSGIMDRMLSFTDSSPLYSLMNLHLDR